MEYRFIQENIDKKTILKSESNINPFLLENNADNIENILKFFNSDKQILLISGFMGTGKDFIAREAMYYLSSDCIVLDYTCFETTILDDILLEFFESFRKLTIQNIISVPKLKSENFTQKINAYFQTIEKPIVIYLSSFDDLLKDSKPEILGFLRHLTTLKNIKIVITGRNFDVEEFENIAGCSRIIVQALQKNIFEKFLRANNIKQIGPLSDELYKHTRGYWLYTALSIAIINLRNYSPEDFLSAHTKSLLSFNDFILREALTFVDPVSGHLFRLLTTIRHSISIKLLKTLNLYDENKISFFVENMILYKNKDNIYLKDYYKTIAENSIPTNISVKLHRGCCELYETQLPLKPLERDILISRQTMRKEIEYHNMFLPKKPLIQDKQLSGAFYFEYGNAIPQKPKPAQQTADEIKHEKDDKLKNLSFVFETEEEEKNFMDNVASSINNFIDKKIKKEKEQAEIKGLTLIQLLNAGKQSDDNYDYQKSLIIYLRALELENDNDYYKFLPLIYIRLAFDYKELSDWFNAIRYYEKALEFYKSAGDEAKIHDINLELAQIHYITFKHEKAQEILNSVVQSPAANVNQKVKAYLLLANLEDNNAEKRSQYYQKANEIANFEVEKPVLSELYYKLGMSLDENDNPQLAVQYYKKCIEIDNNPEINTCLAAALTNIANLYEETSKPDYAIKYYLESLKADETTKNNNGIYQTSLRLAHLYENINSQKSLEYLKKAKLSAEELNELIYIASADLALGDFYFKQNNNELALKYYLNAYNAAKDNFSKDNIFKIEMRIKELELRKSK